ncbi:ankyrin [Hyaloscypha variabilis]
MQAADSQDWERLKLVLRALYIGKGHPLEGPEGVMKLMETRHGFKATTIREKKFKDWGFQKNRTKQDWKVMGQKIGARKRMAKESNVYLDGQLVPTKKIRKEISRQAYMTVSEQLHQAQEPPPDTPPGFEIRTPIAPPLFRIIFENLPIFRFQEIMPQLKELIQPYEIESSALTPFLGELQRTNNPDSRLGSIELFNLMAFLISNNFPGESNSQNIYKWLKKHNPLFVLKILSSIETPSTEALLEKLFRSAVEAEDVSVVKHLIRAGVSPNGHVCRHASLLDHVTPLQYALSRGNTQVAQELIKAGSIIDEVGAGWKSSALVLAIIGKNLRGDERFWWDPLGNSSNDSDEGDVYMDIWSLFEPSLQDFAVHGAENDPFFTLIQSLMNAGAAINLDSTSRFCSSDPHWYDYSPFLDGHSPLTAASKYRHKQLVDVFLQRGADIKFLTSRNASALHECLYSWEDMCADDNSCGSPQPFSEHWRSESIPASDNLSNLVDVARSLIIAGAEVNDESGFGFKTFDCTCDTCDGGILYCTTLDLSVLTGSAELVEMMLCAGACTTTKISIEQASRIGSPEIVGRLLNIGAPVSIEAIGSLMENEENCSYAMQLFQKRPNIRIKRAIFHQAIQIGATSIIEYLFNIDTSNLQALFYDMTEAFVNCCAEGNVDTLRLLLTKSSSFQISISPSLGQAIELAIENGHDDILDILLSAFPDVDVIVQSEGVLLAAFRKKNTRIIKKLTRAGVRLKKRQKKCSLCKREHGSGDVFMAAIELGDYHIINSLIDAGANLHTLGNTDCTLGSKLCIFPLTAAIMAKDLALVNYLITAGAALNNPREAANTTPTPLSAAIANRDLELVNTLIQHGSNLYDSIALAEATNEFRLLQTLLMALHNFNEPVEYALGREALHKAIENQNLVMVHAILNSPLRDMKSIDGLRAGLAKAVSFDFTPNFEIIRTLLSLSADLDRSLKSVVKEGCYHQTIETALFMAIEKNDLRKIELLLEAGVSADKKQTAHLGPSPIYCAISVKNSDILRKLLRYGLDPNKTSEARHKTPIEHATEAGDMEMIKVLLQYGVNLNTSSDDLSHTPLQIAARDGSTEIVDLLLEHGADVNYPPAKYYGATALQFAAIKGLLGIAFILLENGADVNAPPAENGGRTALEGAAEHGRMDMVQLLLNAGANIFQEGRAQYENAVRRASEHGHHAVRRLLESYHG